MESHAERVKNLTEFARKAGHDVELTLRSAGDHEASQVALLAGLLGIDSRLALNLEVPLAVALGAQPASEK
jgi:hypothetical protein